MGVEELSSLKGRRILVTGHTGFKGGWLSIWLDMLGAEVAGLALDPLHEKGVFALSGIGNRIQDNRGDIRDVQAVEGVFSSFRPEIVFHLAAQPLVLESYRRPVETIATNTLGTAHVLQAIRTTPSVRAAVMITSDKCYQNEERPNGYRETDRVGGNDPYSASKGAAELIIASFRRSFFSGSDAPGVASVRAGNVIGGGDWSFDRLVPDIVRAIEKNAVLEIRNPRATRPWQHVLEPLSGYLTVACKLLEEPARFSEAWNFGPLPGRPYPVHRVVEDFLAYFKAGSWRDVSGASRPHEDGLLSLEISKALHRLGWHPVLSYDQMIEFTAKWYLAYHHRDALELCQDQIREYQSLWEMGSEAGTGDSMVPRSVTT